MTRHDALEAVRNALCEHDSPADHHFGRAAVEDILGWLQLHEDREFAPPPNGDLIRRDMEMLVRTLEPDDTESSYLSVRRALSLIESWLEGRLRIEAPERPSALEVKVADTIVTSDKATLSAERPPTPSGGPIHVAGQVHAHVTLTDGGGTLYTDVSAKQVFPPEWARLAIERAIRLPSTPPPSRSVVTSYADELVRKLNEMRGALPCRPSSLRDDE